MNVEITKIRLISRYFIKPVFMMGTNSTSYLNREKYKPSHEKQLQKQSQTRSFQPATSDKWTLLVISYRSYHSLLWCADGLYEITGSQSYGTIDLSILVSMHCHIWILLATGYLLNALTVCEVFLIVTWVSNKSYYDILILLRTPSLWCALNVWLHYF